MDYSLFAKDDCTTELHAGASVGPKGIEPSPNGLKVRYAASYTTAPMFNRGYAFQK